MPGRFSNRMIVSDVDGTLAPEFSVYPQNNVDAIRRFCAQGGFFTIATGRPLLAAQNVIELFEIHGPVILLNGGSIYSTETREYTYSICLPKSAADYVARLTQSPHLQEVRVMAEDDRIYTVYLRQSTDHSLDALLPKYETIFLDLESAAKLRWKKVLLITLVDEAAKFRAFADEQGFLDVDFVASSGFYYEMMPKGINKGSGLRRVAEELGIPLQNTIAVGDYDNDFELLSCAGFAVAPENAVPQVKQLADLVVCHCRDGALAQVVEQLEADLAVLKTL